MVFLKKLELLGFKTFARKTSLSFDKDLNAVIGPNGSGKTNIVDAIQFVLGELSSRSLRATSFSGLLFAGSGEVPKAKHAFVSIHLDNSDRMIPVDTDIVIFSRYIGTDGVSTYRVNGKRYSRGDIVDILGASALSGGMNLIYQGTTMRIADFSPEDRRKNIESIIGISEYERKKHEAQTELDKAEVNLKVAVGKYEEVRDRLLELEKERNDLFRFNYIKNELNRLKAAKLSHAIKELQLKFQKLDEEIVDKNIELDRIKNRMTDLEAQRLEREKEWQNYADKVVDKGSEQLIALQKEIGDLNSMAAGLQTTLSSSKTSIQSYENMRSDKINNLKSIREQVIQSKKEMEKLNRKKAEIFVVLKEKHDARSKILGKVTEIKQTIDDSAAKLSSLEEEIEKVDREYGRLEVKIKAENEGLSILEEQVQILETRKKEFEESFNNFSNGLKNINSLKIKASKRLDDILQTAEKTKLQRDATEAEVRASDKIVKQARLSVKEFESRKELAETVLSEENALEYIDTLVRAGALKGVQGRFGGKIQVSRGYMKAVEASAGGWLQALIVDDMEVVKRCAESLRKTKVGRIKLLPMANLQRTKSVEKPNITGVSAPVASYIDCSAKYKSAVNFVFGDTFLATSENAALKASDQGYRTVTTDGEIYEPGFRLEVGFYREPIDLSEVIPSEIAIKRMNETVTLFEQTIDRRLAELKRLSSEIVKLEGEKILQAETIKFFEHETTILTQNMDRNHKNIVELNRRFRSSQHKYSKLKESINSSQTRNEEIEKQLHSLRIDAANIRKRLKPETVIRFESENATLESEINDLERQSNELDSKITTLKTNIKNVYMPSLATPKEEMAGINKNINRFRKNIETASKQLAEINSKLKEFEASKEKLSSSMLAKREESKKFNEIIEDTNRQMRKVEKESEPLNEVVNTLKQEHLRCDLEIKHRLEELQKLGYDSDVETKDEERTFIDSFIDCLKEEFENLSKIVNMNAADFYEQRKGKYKELSVRINQLEEEKGAVLKFMEEVENEKRDAFNTALGKISQKFSETFNAITNGKGWLQLQNPEDPFAGGIDIIVEFPGKAQMLITGASGGEKSVVAVCYIFALQSLAKHSPFYIFDEIDAHLDPVNVQRLSDLLSKESRASQIIIITFKEAVAAKAKRIFGIYGQNGVSYVHSMPQKMMEVTA
ncbi:MAG: chromosome segregation SMC family protein [Candidatus Bathyarchaeota archaeon]